MSEREDIEAIAVQAMDNVHDFDTPHEKYFRAAIDALKEEGFHITPIDGESVRRRLFDFLAHGDDTHRQWLREAIDAFFDHKPKPAPRSDGESGASASFREYLRDRLSIASEAHSTAVENHNWIDAHSMAVRTKAFGEALQVFDNQQRALAAAQE